jgi:hypothetical protein
LLQYAKQGAYEEMKRLQGVSDDDGGNGGGGGGGGGGDDDDDDARSNKENISVDKCISLTEQLNSKNGKKGYISKQHVLWV